MEPADSAPARPDPEAEQWLIRAVERLRAGDARAAREAAREACRRDPARPHAHYALGQAQLALNEPAGAAEAFFTATSLKPDWADAWVNFGLARYALGSIEDAKSAMRQALTVAPGNKAAIANLGAFLRITGEADAAESVLRQAIAFEPGNVGARLNLVVDLLQEERAEEALALLRQAAVPDDPRAARHWHLQSALALLQLRRPVEARAALAAFAALGPTPPELAPLWLWRQVLLARAEGDDARASAMAAEMEAALRERPPNAVAEHWIMGHYDLAKLFSARGEPARAFAHWRQGHALLARSQPFSRAEHRAFVDASIARLDASRFATGPRARNADPTPVFIVGMPRSGTTLCEQILAAHAQVHGAGERVALAHAFAHLAGGRESADAVGRLAEQDGAALDAAAAAYLAELKALAPDKRLIVDKMPGNFNLLGLVALMLPGARIIHCVRDPRDTGLSIFTFRFYGHHPYAHDLADLGWYIGEHDRLMAHWKAHLPNPILTLPLRDWVDDFDGTLARVLAHLDLPPDPNCARFHETETRVRTVSRAQVRQPVNARGLGRWQTYADELAPLIAELERAGSLAGWPD